MKWGRAVAVVVVCVLLPLLAPAGWVHHGPFPDAAVIAVVYLAFTGGARPAALLGVAIGIAWAPWTADPLGQQAFLLGTLGWCVGRASRSFFRGRAVTQALVVGVCVLALRLVTAGVTEFALARAAGLGGIHGFHGLVVLRGALLAALASAVAAPPLFALLRSSHVLRPFERRRSFRFV